MFEKTVGHLFPAYSPIIRQLFIDDLFRRLRVVLNDDGRDGGEGFVFVVRDDPDAQKAAGSLGDAAAVRKQILARFAALVDGQGFDENADGAQSACTTLFR